MGERHRLVSRKGPHAVPRCHRDANKTEHGDHENEERQVKTASGRAHDNATDTREHLCSWGLWNILVEREGKRDGKDKGEVCNPTDGTE